MARWLVALALVAACGNKSKLDGPDTDTLWDFAPDRTQVGLVASPRAAAALEQAISALQTLTGSTDVAPIKPFLDELATALYGSPTGKAGDAGLTPDRGFAMFVAEGGVIGVMPVADRAKFLASKHGQRGSASDTVNGNTCKPIRGAYVCATSEDMFDRIGKGALRGKVSLAGARGDLELYAPALPLFDGAPGELAITGDVGNGQLSLRGRYTGKPGGVLGMLAGTTAPKVAPEGASGFVAIDLTPLLPGTPTFPLTSDITLADLAATLQGPISIAIPSGSVDIQIHAPLRDPATAKRLIEHCDEITILDRTTEQAPGACRFRLQSASLLELEAWVDGNELRVGAHKAAPAPGSPTGATAIGGELAAGDWSAMFWGRGTLLNVVGVTPSSVKLPADAALAIKMISLIDEVGAAVRFGKDDTRFRLFVRTAWENPRAVVGKLTTISGNDIASGKVGDQAKAIAASAPDAPFAADYAAGQGGLMVPAAVIGMVAAIAMPALRSETGIEPAPGPPGQVDQGQLVTLLVHAYVDEAYPAWVQANPTKTCPPSLAELASYLGAPADVPTMTDAWNQPLVLLCGKDLPPGVKKIAVLSIGPDGKQGTADDVRSWDKLP